eukprot:13787-Heterococcus_DN1.PRE.2
MKSTHHQVCRLLAIFISHFTPSGYVRVSRDGAAHAVEEYDGLWLVARGDMVCADQNWALRKRGIWKNFRETHVRLDHCARWQVEHV